MRLSRRAFWQCALFLLTLCCVPALAGAEPFKCSACHRGLANGSVAHKPVAQSKCLDCHQQFSDDHPLGKGSMGFVVPKDKLCVHCHTTLLKKPMLHKPVALGHCTDCHVPHAGENKSLLKDPAPTLCFRCHPKERFSGTAHGHPPVAKGECLSCHDAHQSDSKFLLKKPGSQLCFMCHDPKLAMGKSVHSPVAKGDCVGCHAVHGSPYRKILKADMPTVLYRPFGNDAWPLCFSCHDPELAGAVTTEKATNFRNGTRNLHAVHVNKQEKGRNCKICHNPHASEQDRLIYPKAPGFGSWDIPIRFTVTPTGGGCSVGCHKTFRYDRVKAVVQ
jgi:predicted CXXCH cytochrome family protein